MQVGPRGRGRRREGAARGSGRAGPLPCTDCASGPTTVMRPVLPSMLIDDTPVSCPRPHGPDRTWRVRGALARTSTWRLICTHLLDLLDAGALLPDGDAYEVRVDGEIHDHAAGHFPLHGKEVRLHALAAVAVAVAVVGVGRGKEGVSAGVGGRTCVCLRLSLSPGGASPRPGSSGAA